MPILQFLKTLLMGQTVRHEEDHKTDYTRDKSGLNGSVSANSTCHAAAPDGLGF